MKTISKLALAACLAAGCRMTPAGWGEPKPAAPVQKTAPIASEPVLYARDGSIVSPKEGGEGLPRRDVQQGEGTRTRLLELYEGVVEERDGLKTALYARESENEQLKQQLAQESARAADLEARLATTERTAGELAQQNHELAGRLTTAQIQRLEAEKKWLELSIATPAKTVPTTLPAANGAGSPAPVAPAAQPPGSKDGR